MAAFVDEDGSKITRKTHPVAYASVLLGCLCMAVLGLVILLYVILVRGSAFEGALAIALSVLWVGVAAVLYRMGDDESSE